MPIRVVLADDHPIVLHGLQQLFDGEPDFTIVDCCREGESALAAVRAAPVDILVLDLRMPGRTGLDVMRAIAAERLECKTVLLTGALTDDEAVEATRLGARGVVLKESPAETLLECVRKVYRGERWIDPDTISRAFSRALKRDSAARVVAQSLTPREGEIVRMVAQGLRNRAVAERLAISEGTVKIHLHNIYEKLGVDGRLALVLLAQEKGLV